MRRRLILAAAALAGVTAVLLSFAGHGRPASATGPSVVVLRSALRAGATADPANLVLVPYPRRLVPAGALSSVDQAAFRAVAVGIPPGLPLIATFLRDPRAAAPLRPGERAVGVRVDDVTGLPQLLVAGSHVDVLVRGALHVSDAEVLSRPRRNGDGVTWSIALRLPAAQAAQLAASEARGDEIRLLPRGVRP
jgi:Flp pilus assembly protein CpaB